MFSCKSFLDLSAQERRTRVKQLKVYFNCLRVGHKGTECKSSHCRKCDKSHNTLIHIDTSTQVNTQHTEKTDSQGSNTQTQLISNSVVNHAISNDNMHNILVTAVVHIMDSNGKAHDCIALLDGESQSNFMTTSTSSFESSYDQGKYSYNRH